MNVDYDLLCLFTPIYLMEIVSPIKGNCFKTSHLLIEINFGRAPKFVSMGYFGLVPNRSDTGTFIFTKKVALRAAVWPGTATASRPAARVDGLYIVLVESVIILIGLDINLRANGLAVSQRASADQGDAYGEKALSGLRRR